MTVEAFFNLLLKELEENLALRPYYRFLESPSVMPFRRAYFCRRLEYILRIVEEYIVANPGRAPRIWDCGCGYATTQIFLALNGYASTGNTLEFYFKEIPKRLEFWKQYGDMGKVTVSYEDLFEKATEPESTDIIIVQDTLHHLEPLQESLKIFNHSLRKGGIVISIEENGSNLIQRFKLFLRRGNQRVIEYYDDRLGRRVMMGNENIRPLLDWKIEFERANLAVIEKSLTYIRLFPPFFFRFIPIESIVNWENSLWRKHSLLRHFFYFGINFIAQKKRDQ